MHHPILECRNVAKTFIKGRRSIPVLKDVDFNINPGETVVISGKSGQGKSVLLWLLAGLDRPSGGEIVINGESLNQAAPARLAQIRREDLAIIFQDFNLIPTWTALENVLSALVHTKMKKKLKQEKALDLLTTLGLEGKEDHLPSELSIGQRQRVAIARSLISEPGIILADEPAGGLDPDAGERIIELLTQPVLAGKAALIIATHGTLPLQSAHRRLILENGILQEASPGP